MRFLVLALIVLSYSAKCKVISLDTVLEHTMKTYPDLRIQKLKFSNAQQKALEALGKFDLELESKPKSYFSGYYDGKFADIYLDKPIQSLNSRAQVGFRQSKDNFPVYHGELDTAKGGEFFLSFSASLLKFRSIDPDRFKILEAKNLQSIIKLQLGLKKIDLLTKVNDLYFKWALLEEKQKIYQQLIDVNQNRLTAIKKRVKSDDLARIYVTEAQEYLLNFQNQLIQTQIQLQKTINSLQVFYPPLSTSDKPAVDFENVTPLIAENYSYQDAFDYRPELKILGLLKELNTVSTELARQYLKPTLDFESAYFKGQNSDMERFQEEGTLALKLSIPIERNLGKAKVAQQKNKFKILDAQEGLLKRQIKNEIQNLKTEIQGDFKLIKNLKQEVANAKKLQSAEWIKFRSGASDFFITNTRDINFLKAYVNYLERIAAYKIASFDLKLWYQDPSQL